MRLRLSAVGLLAMQLLACKDAVAPNESTGIIVTVKLAGVYPFDAFGIRIDDRPMSLSKSEPGLVITGLNAGSHTVALSQLPANCQNDGPTQLTVQTTSANLSAADFRVTCIAVNGSIAIAATISDYDKPLALTAQVDSTIVSFNLRPNKTTVIDRSFDGGSHVVKLSEIPTFCEATGSISTSVTLKTGAVKKDTAMATFSIRCGAPPKLGVDTAAAIAFERDGYVMVVRESGSTPVALAEGEHPSWSHDGKLIAFEKLMSCDDFGCDHDLWLMDGSGNNPRTIGVDMNADDYDAAISPDSKKIAFIRFAPGIDMTFLGVSNVNGDSLAYVSIWSPSNSPSWSPDGSQLVFSCGRGGVDDLCLISPEKRCFLFADRCDLSEDHLTTLPGNEWDPSWSPDGKRIAFTAACSAGPQVVCPAGATQREPLIAVVDVASRIVTTLTRGHDPAWSPDGSQLVFTGNASSPGIKIYKFFDSSVRQLTTSPADRAPSWRE